MAMADPETYSTHAALFIALLGKVHRYLGKLPVLALFTSIISRLSDKLLQRHAKVA